MSRAPPRVGKIYRGNIRERKGTVVSKQTENGLSRREVIQAAGGIAVAGALAGVAIPAVHAAESNTIQVALVGCGGRGTGAAENALSTKAGPVKLVAMADVFQDRL